MSQPLPHLPKPEFVLVLIEAPPEVPAQIAADLGTTGIPGGLIGYEYRPLREPAYFREIGERRLVAIATSGLFGLIAVDMAKGHVVQIPKAESATATHVNRDLGSFNSASGRRPCAGPSSRWVRSSRSSRRPAPTMRWNGCGSWTARRWSTPATVTLQPTRWSSR